MILQRPGRLAIFLALLVSIFLLLPLLAVVPVSFTPKRFLSLPSGEWSLRHYRALVENPAWASGLWLSVRIGLDQRRAGDGLGDAFQPWHVDAAPAILRVEKPSDRVALLPMVAPPVVSA